MTPFSDAERAEIIQQYRINSHTTDRHLYWIALHMWNTGKIETTCGIGPYLRALRDDMARAEQERENRHE